MRITCKRIELAKALHKIAKVVSVQKGQPILSNILLTVDENLTIKCRSLSSYLKLTLNGEIDVKGECCTFASKIIDAIDSFTCEFINLETVNNLLIIKGGGNILKLETVNPEYYPTDKIYNNFNVIQSLKLKNKELNDSIQKCLPFVNDRGVTSGINFNFKNKKLSISGCSNVAACFIELDSIQYTNETFIDFTLPTKDATNISSIFTKEEITIDISERYIKINSPEGFFIINKMEGKYPNFEMLFKSDYKYELSVDKLKMEEAFKIIDIVATSNIATIGYTSNNCCITYGKSVKSVIEIDTPSLVENIVFGIDYSYLRKIFKFLTDNNSKLYFKEERKPILIRDNNAIFFISLATAQPVDF